MSPIWCSRVSVVEDLRIQKTVLGDKAADFEEDIQSVAKIGLSKTLVEGNPIGVLTPFM